MISIKCYIEIWVPPNRAMWKDPLRKAGTTVMSAVTHRRRNGILDPGSMTQPQVLEPFKFRWSCSRWKGFGFKEVLSPFFLLNRRQPELRRKIFTAIITWWRINWGILLNKGIRWVVAIIEKVEGLYFINCGYTSIGCLALLNEDITHMHLFWSKAT